MKPGIDYTGVTVVFGCHDGKGKFLLTKRGPGARDEQGTWEFGGGTLEFGESVEEALRREMQEEYGCYGEISEVLAPFSLNRVINGIKTHWILLPHIMKINPDHFRANPDEHVADFGWFRLEDFPTPMHPGEIKIMEHYKDYFLKYS